MTLVSLVKAWKIIRWCMLYIWNWAPEGPEDTSKLYEQMTQILMAFISFVFIPLPQLIHITSWGLIMVNWWHRGKTEAKTKPAPGLHTDWHNTLELIIRMLLPYHSPAQRWPRWWRQIFPVGKAKNSILVFFFFTLYRGRSDLSYEYSWTPGQQ